MKKPCWEKFEWDDEDKKNGNTQHLRDHAIEPGEAEECFFRDFVFARDKRRFDDIYVMEGKTDRGRRLRLVLRDKGKGLARIITGWTLNHEGKKGNEKSIWEPFKDRARENRGGIPSCGCFGV